MTKTNPKPKRKLSKASLDNTLESADEVPTQTADQFAEIEVTTKGETWLRNTATLEDLVRRVESLARNCAAYLDGRGLSPDEVSRLTRELSFNDLFKAIGDALLAYNFAGFQGKGRAEPPAEQFRQRYADFAAVYVVNVAHDLVPALKSVLDGATLHPDEAAVWARAYSEMMLCRMVLGLEEAKVEAIRLKNSRSGRSGGEERRKQIQAAAAEHHALIERKAMRLLAEGTKLHNLVGKLCKDPEVNLSDRQIRVVLKKAGVLPTNK